MGVASRFQKCVPDRTGERCNVGTASAVRRRRPLAPELDRDDRDSRSLRRPLAQADTLRAHLVLMRILTSPPAARHMPSEPVGDFVHAPGEVCRLMAQGRIRALVRVTVDSGVSGATDGVYADDPSRRESTDEPDECDVSRLDEATNRVPRNSARVETLADHRELSVRIRATSRGSATLPLAAVRCRQIVRK